MFFCSFKTENKTLLFAQIVLIAVETSFTVISMQKGVLYHLLQSNLCNLDKREVIFNPHYLVQYKFKQKCCYRISLQGLQDIVFQL